MKKLIQTTSLVFVLVLSIGMVTTTVLAAPNSQVDLVEDSADGVIDMAGPTVGFVNTNQNKDGDLRVVAKAIGLTPLTTYTVYLVGGPTHAASTGFIAIGTLTTNAIGNGNTGAIWVDAETMGAPPFGEGPHHLDILDGGDGISLTAAPIAYSLP